METIIQEKISEAVEEIVKKAVGGEIFHFYEYTEDVLEICKRTAVSAIEATVVVLNEEIRKDKAARKESGLTLHKREQSRYLETRIGRIEIKRDYYFNTKTGSYEFPVDEILGLVKRERVGADLASEMVENATRYSYAKSAEIVTGGAVSRQTARNKLLKVGPQEKQIEEDSKREVEELHIFADEDHVHMQKPGKVRGKANQIVPLVTVTEGMISCGSRRKLFRPMHFVDPGFNTARLWESVEGYILKSYDLESLKHIYIHGDGAPWIVKGLESFPQTVHVMDEFHFNQNVKKVSSRFRNYNVRHRIREAIKDDDLKKALAVLDSLYNASDMNEDNSDAVEELRTYLMNHWEAIVRRFSLNLPGCCTEGLVSHLLSERVSRDPQGWGKEGLGALTSLRIFCENGGSVDYTYMIDGKTEKHSYAELAEEYIAEAVNGSFDWSIFEHQPPIFDGNSGTQRLLSTIGLEKSNIIGIGQAFYQL